MELAKIINGLKNNYKKHQFSALRLNSKECRYGDVFFAIKGLKKNGNFYIKDAINNGAKTIISDNKFQGFKDDVLYLKQKKPRKFLALLASKIYKNKPKNLIAVTGTNGKSSIADFYYQILTLNKVKSACIGTLGVKNKNFKSKTNNTTPDILTIHKILNKIKKNKTNNVIIEASSHGLHQNRLNNIKFDVGIFTNLSKDHLDYHKSLKEYFKSKLILFQNLVKKNGYAIFKNEIPQTKVLKKICNIKKIKILSLGKGGTLEIINNRIINNHQYVTFNFKNKQYSFKTSLIGKIQIDNLLMAVLAANKVIPISKIVKVLHKIKSINGRLEIIGNIKNLSTVILDYAHTPEAINSCIKNIKKHFKYSNISILFGCGGERDKSKREDMGKIANDLCQKIYLTDDNPRSENPSEIRKQIKRKINKKKLYEIPSRKLAIKKAINDLKSGDVLIVAGKGHENYQEYNSKISFSDKKFINIFIRNKNKLLSKHWKTNILKEKLPIKFEANKLNIKSASLNSKKIKKGQVFIGVKGKKFDGNKYANAALDKKASLAIVDKNYSPTKFNKIVVKNSLNVFSDLSSQIRKSSNLNIIGITGSAGKTSLKELIGKTFSKMHKTTYSIKSYNNKYGVPLSLFNIKKKSNFGVFEIGMDKKGEIHNLSRLVKPLVGIITNISHAHIKNFKNLKEIAHAKSEIIDNIIEDGTMILNKDDKFFNFFKIKSLNRGLKIISISKKKKADIRLIKIRKSGKKYKVLVNILGNNISFLINETLIDFLDNLLFCIGALSIYYEMSNLKKNLFDDFKPLEGRGNTLKLRINSKTIYLIDESYNSNPLSLNFSLKKFNRLKLNKVKKHLLLGDMLELGKFSKHLHTKAASNINKINVNKVNVYGKYIKFTYNKLKTQKKGKIINSTDDIMKIIKNLNNKDYLFIKGSNSTGLNRIVSKLKKNYAL